MGKIPWRRAWQATGVFLPGEFPGHRSPAGYSPKERKDSDTAEQLKQQQSRNQLIFRSLLGGGCFHSLVLKSVFGFDSTINSNFPGVGSSFIGPSTRWNYFHHQPNHIYWSSLVAPLNYMLTHYPCTIQKKKKKSGRFLFSSNLNPFWSYDRLPTDSLTLPTWKDIHLDMKSLLNWVKDFISI